MKKHHSWINLIITLIIQINLFAAVSWIPYSQDKWDGYQNHGNWYSYSNHAVVQKQELDAGLLKFKKNLQTSPKATLKNITNDLAGSIQSLDVQSVLEMRGRELSRLRKIEHESIIDQLKVKKHRESAGAVEYLTALGLSMCGLVPVGITLCSATLNQLSQKYSGLVGSKAERNIQGALMLANAVGYTTSAMSSFTNASLALENGCLVSGYVSMIKGTDNLIAACGGSMSPAWEGINALSGLYYEIDRAAYVPDSRFLPANPMLYPESAISLASVAHNVERLSSAFGGERRFGETGLTIVDAVQRILTVKIGESLYSNATIRMNEELCGKKLASVTESRCVTTTIESPESIETLEQTLVSNHYAGIAGIGNGYTVARDKYGLANSLVKAVEQCMREQTVISGELRGVQFDGLVSGKDVIVQDHFSRLDVISEFSINNGLLSHHKVTSSDASPAVIVATSKEEAITLEYGNLEEMLKTNEYDIVNYNLTGFEQDGNRWRVTAFASGEGVNLFSQGVYSRVDDVSEENSQSGRWSFSHAHHGAILPSGSGGFIYPDNERFFLQLSKTFQPTNLDVLDANRLGKFDGNLPDISFEIPIVIDEQVRPNDTSVTGLALEYNPWLQEFDMRGGKVDYIRDGLGRWQCINQSDEPLEFAGYDVWGNSARIGANQIKGSDSHNSLYRGVLNKDGRTYFERMDYQKRIWESTSMLPDFNSLYAGESWHGQEVKRISQSEEQNNSMIQANQGKDALASFLGSGIFGEETTSVFEGADFTREFSSAMKHERILATFNGAEERIAGMVWVTNNKTIVSRVLLAQSEMDKHILWMNEFSRGLNLGSTLERRSHNIDVEIKKALSSTDELTKDAHRAVIAYHTRELLESGQGLVDVCFVDQRVWAEARGYLFDKYRAIAEWQTGEGDIVRMVKSDTWGIDEKWLNQLGWMAANPEQDANQQFEQVSREIGITTDYLNSSEESISCFINGIWAKKAEAEEWCRMLEPEFGTVHLVYNETSGKGNPVDIIECVADKFGVQDECTVSASDFISASLANGKKVQLIAHSQGALKAANAVREVISREYYVSPQTVHVITLGGAAMRFSDGPEYQHYVNLPDAVPLFFGQGNPISKLFEPDNSTVIWCPNWSAGAVSHLIDYYIPEMQISNEEK